MLYNLTVCSVKATRTAFNSNYFLAHSYFRGALPSLTFDVVGRNCKALRSDGGRNADSNDCTQQIFDVLTVVVEVLLRPTVSDSPVEFMARGLPE